MTPHHNDPEITEIARDLLDRHHSGATEQNVLSAARAFLVATELFDSRELGEQIAIGGGLVDLIGRSHIFEFKRRVGALTHCFCNPNWAVASLDL